MKITKNFKISVYPSKWIIIESSRQFTFLEFYLTWYQTKIFSLKIFNINIDFIYYGGVKWY